MVSAAIAGVAFVLIGITGYIARMASKSLRRSKCQVAGGHALSVAAAKDLIAAGGNAVDGAIGSFFVACMAEPMLTSVAGGGFIMVHDPVTGDRICFDGVPHQPHVKSSEPPTKIEVDFGTVVQPFLIGAGTVASPGALGACLTVHEKYGKLPLSAVLAPAIAAARDGVVITPFTEKTFNFLRGIISHTESSRELFHRPPAPGATEVDLENYLKAGDVYKNPAYADFLTKLAANPNKDALKDSFLAAGLNYETVAVDELKPLETKFDNGYSLVTVPPPYPGGLLISYAVKKVLETKPTSGSERLVAISTALRDAATIRKAKVDGHLHEIDIVENLMGSTTQLSVIDPEGMAVSMTTSNGEGAGIVLPDTGIMVSNFLGEEDLNPGGSEHPPGAPLPSMMSPSFVMKDGVVVAAIGSGGSERIRSVVTKATVDVMAGLPLAELQGPRVHWDGKAVQVEPVDETVKEAIRSAHEDVEVVFWEEPSMYFGGLHAATVNGSTADQRRDGAC